MCGIGGAVAVHDEAMLAGFADQIISSLAHRGPDDIGIAHFPGGILAHRRLAILDPTPAGHQPYKSRDGRYLIVYNGEVYNYLELRDELIAQGRQFTTDSDTEVILEAYAAWGPAAIERFNGIWAFALWDDAAKQLLLSRDRLGVKPLYLTKLGGGWAFASEIKALRGVASGVEPNLSALRDYATLGLLDHADATFYRGIEPLPPATNMIVGPETERRWRYWTPTALTNDNSPEPRRGDADRIDEFAALFSDAVGLQLRSDVPLGSCLSGGIDSSAIVAISSRLVAGRLGPHATAPRVALTASFPGSQDDETELATLVARSAGVEHRLVNLAPSDLIATLETVLREQDEPFASASILAQRAVMEAARANGIKVMLDGQGADEMLGGYPHYRYAWLLGLLTRHPLAVPGALRELRGYGIPPAVALRQSVLDSLRLRSSRAPIGRDARLPGWVGPRLRASAPLQLRGWDHPSPSGTPLTRMLHRALTSTSLPALLRYEDRNSMRFGVEARVPYLDHRLVEAALLLPDRLKIRHGITKVALREAMVDVVPDEVRLQRRKIGFAVPQVAWFESSMPAVRAYLNDSQGVSLGILDRKGLVSLLDVPPSRNGGVDLWRALSIEAWLRNLAA